MRASDLYSILGVLIVGYGEKSWVQYKRGGDELEGGTRGKTRRGGENARERSFLPYGCPPWLFSRIKKEKGTTKGKGECSSAALTSPP